MQFSSIQPNDRALSSTTIPSQSGPGSNGNEEMLCIPQSSSITETSSSDCLVSYPGNSLGRALVYSTAPAKWAIHRVNVKTVLFQIIQFSISTQFKCQNSSILNNSV